ncbi:MAG: hypothetical protein K2P12_04970, partial [Clostridia bacterium]|nr:hypothetical protein [Clostridia bacterium]
NQYWSFANYIYDKFDKCSSEIQSELLRMYGIIYAKWEGYDKSEMAFKYAIKYNRTNKQAHFQLVKLYKELDYKEKFHNAYTEYIAIDTEAMFNEEFNLFMQSCMPDDFEEGRLTLVDEEFRLNRKLDSIKELLAGEHFEEAIELLEEMQKESPKFEPLYEALAYAYMSVFDTEKLREISATQMEYFPDKSDAIALFLYMRRFDEDFQYDHLIDKLIAFGISNLVGLMRICEILDARGNYSKCKVLIEDYAQKYDCAYNYDILMMSAVTNIKLGNIDKAKEYLKKVDIAYGILGISGIYKFLLDSGKDEINIATFNNMPDCLTEKAQKYYAKLLEEKNKGIEINSTDFWNVFELIVVTCDEDIIIEYLKTFKEQFTIKNVDKILSLIYNRQITDTTKSAIMYGVIACGVKSFTMFVNGGIAESEFIDIPELEKFPNCYREAYIYAFVYCALNTHDFAKNVHDSALEVLKLMADTKRIFNDPYALAGAIICNAYVIVADNIVETVGLVIGCNSKRIQRYINIIKKNGEFFDLDEDDIFEVFIKRIAGKFGDIDKF